MKKPESFFNTKIKNAIVASGGWSYKIPDSGSRFGIKRPFDGFGVTKSGVSLYWEAKYLGGPVAFNFKNALEDHQIENLTSIKKLMPNALCLVILGVKVGRGDTRVYIFDFNLISSLIEKGQESFHWKVLNTLKYTPIIKEVFTFDDSLTIL